MESGNGNGDTVSLNEKSFLLNQKPVEPITVSWENVGYAIKEKKGTKVLLDNVSGWARPGILAILGASGAGKTTLMNLLAQRVRGGEVTGTILFNGKKAPKKIGSVSGYVMQEDLFLGALTVRETLKFRAMLVLGSKANSENIAHRVETVLEELNLKKCADSKVGNVFVRGISGGEKKRLNIGVELISQPSLLFLDEPTSGLDSFTSYNVMETLNKIAANQRTIICTIHQPRSNIFTLFDKILLLSEGKQMYFGDAKECVNYFAKLGYPVPNQMNPTDHFLDTISLDSRTEEALKESQKRIEYFSQEFQKELNQALYQNRLTINNIQSSFEISTEYPSSFFKQLAVLTHRNFYVIIRSHEATIAKIVQALFLGLIIGLIYLQIGLTQQSVQDRQGLLYLLVVNQAFGGMFSALILFQQEKEIFYSERRAGLYRVSSFFISKFFSELPWTFLTPLLFGTVCYFMAGLQMSAEKYGINMLALCFTALAAQGMGFAISTGSPNMEVANLIAPLIVVILFLFGGFFANLDSIPVYFIWLENLSFIKWGYEIVAVNEFKGLVFECPPEGFCAYPDGESVLEFLSMSNVDIIINFAILLGIAAGFQVVAYLLLLFLKR
jgi:ABC-type multidrug transport system ATPase subunit